ncbi:intraflagellar transport protein 22 homolog [Ischnura elegans]|uniref:intraflagellar transport protein 22 homolog n=1 Tax=Ischnura elegans TaxID=197161 RepID=UPI001ED88B4C|nr:intraflagellar transport protein 22 homolog [Ischnura elegans]
MFKAKIAVLGPVKSGKTSICNILSNAVERYGGDYRPTKGVRILEFESSYLQVNEKNINCEIELWDCSGDQKYKPFWPVFLHKTVGCILVYDPTSATDAKELDLFYDCIVDTPTNELQSCVVFANNKEKNKRVEKKLSSKFDELEHVIVDIEDDIKGVKSSFDAFLVDLLKKLWDMQYERDDLIH